MIGLSLSDAIKIGAGGLLGALLAAGPVFLYAKSAVRTEIAAQATKEALANIERREQNNEKFRNWSDHDRCRAIMRDSGLPENECSPR